MAIPRKKPAFVIVTTKGPLEVATAPRYGYFIKPAGKARNLMDLNKLVEAGLPYKSVKPLVEFLDLHMDELAAMTGVSRRTVLRWEPDTVLGPLPSKNLVMIDAVVFRGIDVFGTAEAFRSWLKLPNNVLGDQRPLDLLTTPYGVELVEDALTAMEYGQVM